MNLQIRDRLTDPIGSCSVRTYGDPSAHHLQHRQQAGARRIDADVAQQQPLLCSQGASDQEKSRRREIRRTSMAVPVRGWPPATLTVRPVRATLTPKAPSMRSV